MNPRFSSRQSLLRIYFLFFFIGFLTHGLAATAGILGMLMGAKVLGLLGAIGNAVIILVAIVGLLIGVADF